jgi:membrane-associated protein
MAQMPPARFTAYNALGAAAWAGALTYAGYFFGNIPWVRRNLTLLIVGIIVVSLVPLGVAFMRSRMAARAGS